MNTPKYSIIIPVYNRPEEINELLNSLTFQSFKNFEVLIIEDGSMHRCESIVEHYQSTLSIQYFYKQNEGPGPTRNFGYKHAKGEFFVVFDSDCIIPSTYFEAVEQALAHDKVDAWGGPDRAHQDFTLVQRAMGYTMSSILTTGGIRGGKKHMGWFQPRSFNMGISSKVFEMTGGFKFDRYAEDIEFSIRMKNAGLYVVLIEDAFVFHKRRATFSQFYKQVFNFGKGRALIGKVHPTEVKITHWFPTVFTLCTIALILLPFVNITLFRTGFVCFSLYAFMIFIHSWISNKNFTVGILSIPSAMFQLWGYGLGFMKEKLKG